MTLALLLLLLQTAPDPFAPIRFLEGRWKGEASGQPGKGVSEREYRFELKGKFLVAKNKSAWEKEVHEDLGIFSYDRAAKALVLRQFHVEGFVNEYKLSASGGNRLEFTTFLIENIPNGWRAREIYTRVSDDEFVETFQLAPPGKEFELYSETRFKRIR